MRTRAVRRKARLLPPPAPPTDKELEKIAAEHERATRLMEGHDTIPREVREFIVESPYYIGIKRWRYGLDAKAVIQRLKEADGPAAINRLVKSMGL